MRTHVCPWWLAYTFDNPLRKMFHDPQKIFAPYLHEGMRAADLGCGMGYFSIAMAKIVGESGKVLSVDIQPEMLDVLRERAEKEGVAKCIATHLCDAQSLGVNEKVDFALAFWMVHETPDVSAFLRQVHGILEASGRLLLAEPKIHVTSVEFEETVAMATASGFRIVDSPEIFFSHAAVFAKRSEAAAD